MGDIVFRFPAPGPEPITGDLDGWKKVEGNPTMKTWVQHTSNDGSVISGTWEATPGTYHATYGAYEFVHLIDGQITITPDSGQTGKSLAWTAVKGANGDPGMDDAAQALTVAAKPKRTVESLVAGLIGYIGKTTDGDTIAGPHGVIIVVDQATGNVVVQTPGDDAAAAALSAALAAVAPGTTDMAAVELSAPAMQEETNPPVFEGGSTS